MPEDATKGWLYQRSQEQWCDQDLEMADIDWIMRHEGNQTKLMRWERDPASGGDQTPASGGSWFINSGNVIMLAELVWYAYDELTFYDIYRMWLSLPIFAFKRKHSENNSEKAQKVRNAKHLQHQETGYWGLNSRRQRRG